MAADRVGALPCGRTVPYAIADHLLQVSICRQKMVDAVQAGDADRARDVGRVLFRIAANVPQAP